jgi:hypothetical protein
VRGKLELDLNAIGRGTVKLNGQDVGDVVKGVTFHSEAGLLTEVILTLSAVAVEFRGDAQMRRILDDVPSLDENRPLVIIAEKEDADG